VETVCQFIVCSPIPPFVPPQQVYHQVPFTTRADHVYVIRGQGVSAVQAATPSSHDTPQSKRKISCDGPQAILQDMLTLCEFIIPSVRKRENVRDVDR
jgi:hypothetical protein